MNVLKGKNACAVTTERNVNNAHLVVPFMPTKRSRHKQQRVNPLTDSVESLTNKLSTLSITKHSSSSRRDGNSKSSHSSLSASSSKENLEELWLAWQAPWKAGGSNTPNESRRNNNNAIPMQRSKSFDMALEPEAMINASSSSPKVMQRSSSDRELSPTSTPLSECNNGSPKQSSASTMSRFILPPRQQQQNQARKQEKSSPNDGSLKLMAGMARSNPATTSPQQHLEHLLKTRGYNASSLIRRAMDTAFYCRPTEFQTASYGSVVVHAVRSGHSRQLRELLKHLSANPCTPRGESLWHMVCRCGSVKLLKVLMQQEAHPKLCQVVSDFGRTVLHDAAWASQPALDVVQLLMDRNPLLVFLQDGRGTLPLSYIASHHWPLWKEFLDTHADAWFPSAGPTWQYQQALEWLDAPPNSRPWHEPKPSVSMQVATMIASGHTNLLEMMEQGGAEGTAKNRDIRAATEPIPDDIGPTLGDDFEVLSDFEDLDLSTADDDKEDDEDSSLFSSGADNDNDFNSVDDLKYDSGAKIILGGAGANQMVDYIQQFPFRT